MGNRSTISEASIEKALAQEVKSAGGWCLKLPAVFDAGIPDRICLFPGARVVFVELKAPGKKPRKLQAVIHNRIRALGFRVEVVDNKEQAINLISEYKNERE